MKIKYEILLFIIESIYMILELIASRVLSPYFGNTNIIWTSIIGIILLSSSIGNFFGGKLADKSNNENNIKIILLLTSFFILLIPLVSEQLLVFLTNKFESLKVGAILSTLVLFFIPSLLIGFINPNILKIKVKNIDNVGNTTGRIYALSTLGGIFGTFLGGFYLIPSFGSKEILFVLSITVLLLSLFFKSKKFNIPIIMLTIIFITINIILFFNYFNKNYVNSTKILNNDDNVSLKLDTQYGRVVIKNDIINNQKIRTLNIDGGFESATYRENNSKKYELIYTYTMLYDLMFKSDIDISNTLMIGGGGFSYPKYYISHFDTKKMDVVEIDEKVINIAKKYFYLDDLIREYKIKKNKRLRIINEDGRIYLNKNSKKYDAILNDAFSGNIPPNTLTTIEAIQKIKDSLVENGLYLCNIHGNIKGKYSKFLTAEVNTLNKVFKNVYVIPTNYSLINDEDIIQNFMVIATDQLIDYTNTVDIEVDKNTIVLTDDYSPIDNLIAIKL